MTSQRKAFPNNVPFYADLNFEKLGFKTRDESAAWMLSAFARRIAYRQPHFYGGASNVLRIPFDTWLIGYPTSRSGRLADWFNKKEPTTCYRLMIHRLPRCFSGATVSIYPFAAVHGYGSIRQTRGNLFRIRRGHGSFGQLKPDTLKFLENMLTAYQEDAAQSFVKGCGHPLWFANALPDARLG